MASRRGGGALSQPIRFLARAVAATSLGLLLALPSSMAWAQTEALQKADRPQAPKTVAIDRNGIIILVRTTLLALDQANRTGNYSVLRDLGSSAFRARSAADLAEIFAKQRKQELNLGGVAVLEPQLTLMPQMEANGLLRMAGFFPSVPIQVNFELLFAAENREWKILGISVNLTSGAPVAPETDLAPPRPVSTETPAPPTPRVNPRRLQTTQ